jgi:transposase
MAILGNDVSKATFDATLIDELGQQHHQQFTNDKAGFKQLQKWLKQHQIKQLHACLEATNIYWEQLAEYLYQQGYTVSVVNPARIKGFAQSQLRRNKTDKQDSQVIAQFCARTQPKAWQPPSPEQRKLRALVRHLQNLKRSLIQHTNRLKTCQDAEVRHSLELIIETFKAQIAQTEAQIQAFIDQSPDLKEKQELLISIKGIGPKTANHLLAEMYDLDQYDSARAAAADAGLTPAHYQSGTSVKQRPKLSKVGKVAVRGALYLPAIAALQHNPLLQDLQVRLSAAGKHPQVIIGAAMRKLLHLAYGVLKHRQPFDPAYLA